MIDDIKFNNTYRIPSNRLQAYDYGSSGCYYVTICTKDRVHYFGEIVEDEMQLSGLGEIAKNIWIEIPKQFNFVILDQYVIMPNHLHGVLIFNKSDDTRRDVINHVSTTQDCTNTCKDVINHVSTTRVGGITGHQNPMLHQNLGRVMRWFKGRTSFECRKLYLFAWQERFHDRIIRDNVELDNVRNYIFSNPQNWINDKLNKPVET